MLLESERRRGQSCELWQFRKGRKRNAERKTEGNRRDGEKVSQVCNRDAIQSTLTGWFIHRGWNLNRTSSIRKKYLYIHTVHTVQRMCLWGYYGRYETWILQHLFMAIGFFQVENFVLELLKCTKQIHNMNRNHNVKINQDRRIFSHNDTISFIQSTDTKWNSSFSDNWYKAETVNRDV